MPRAEASSTRYWVSGTGQQHRVRKAQFVVERLRRRDGRAGAASTCAIRSLVEVLPDEPVTSTMRALSRPATAVASAVSAAIGSATRMRRRPTGRVASTADRAALDARPPRSRGRPPARRLMARNRSPATDLAAVELHLSGYQPARLEVDQPTVDDAAISRALSGIISRSRSRPWRSPALRHRCGTHGAARASRSTVTSSKGSITPPTSWPVSWPLPAISTVSPGSASAIACSMARAPVALLDDLGTPAGR